MNIRKSITMGIIIISFFFAFFQESGPAKRKETNQEGFHLEMSLWRLRGLLLKVYSLKVLIG
jgi:hypothetical protein